MQLTPSSGRRGVALGAVIACVAACSVAACNGNSANFTSGGFGGEAFAGPTGSAVPPSGASFPPSAAPICPQAGPPIDGETCFSSSGSVSDVCEYGGSADPSCNVIARCPANQGAWTVEQPTHCPTTCPAHFDERVPGGTCAGTELCTYLEATCGCAGAIDGAWTSITGGSNDVSDAGDEASAPDGGDAGDAAPAAIGRWQCVRAGGGCPARRPVEGTHCTKAIDCDYGSCVFGVPLAYTCINERWTALYVGSCP